MAVTDDAFSTSLWNEVRTLLVGNIYVTNSTSGSTTLASVEASWNDTTATRPTVIIRNPEDDENEWKFGSEQGHKVANIFIDCIYKNSLGVSQMKDQIYKIAKENEIEGVELVGLTSSYSDPSEYSQQKYHSYSITLTYDRE